MFKYKFQCTDENFTRTKFENIMTSDRPCGRGIFGNNLFGGGLHFTECGERIKGIFLDSSEAESIAHSSPIRVSFNGAFKTYGDKTVFEVYIYPNLFETVFLTGAFAAMVAFSNLMGGIIGTVVFSAFIIGYYSNIKKTVAEFEIMVR